MQFTITFLDVVVLEKFNGGLFGFPYKTAKAKNETQLHGTRGYTMSHAFGLLSKIGETGTIPRALKTRSELKYD